MKNHTRGFVGIALAIIVAVAAIGGGAYVYVQNREESGIADTVVATSTEVGIETSVQAKADVEKSTTPASQSTHPGLTKRQVDAVADARIRAYVSELRPVIDLYFDTHKTYIGICGGGTLRESKDPKIAELHKNIRDALGYNNYNCYATSLSYVYAAELTTGGRLCIDSSGFSGTITAPPQLMSCK